MERTVFGFGGIRPTEAPSTWTAGDTVSVVACEVKCGRLGGGQGVPLTRSFRAVRAPTVRPSSFFVAISISNAIAELSLRAAQCLDAGVRFEGRGGWEFQT